MIIGSKKWNTKNLLSVGLHIIDPPHIKVVMLQVEKIFVMTVPPQKLICPQVNTYPRKAVTIKNIKSTTPDNHNITLIY
jgi:hypothetical protein